MADTEVALTESSSATDRTLPPLYINRSSSSVSGVVPFVPQLITAAAKDFFPDGVCFAFGGTSGASSSPKPEKSPKVFILEARLIAIETRFPMEEF